MKYLTEKIKNKAILIRQNLNIKNLGIILKDCFPSSYTNIINFLSFPRSIIDLIKSQLFVKLNKLDRMHESVEFAIAQMKEGNCKDARKIISNILCFPLEKSNGLPSEYIDNLLLVIDKSIQNKHIEGVNDFLNKTYKIDFRLLSHKGWLNLYSLLVRNGLVKAGYSGREKAVKRIYNDASLSTNPIILSEGMKASIDQGDFQRAERFLRKITENKTDYCEINELKAYYFLNIGENRNAQKILRKQFTNEERNFLNYIKGKTVAVVGPAASEYDYGEEIDSFDIVVRVGYRGHKKKLEPRKYGTKTDISYYHGPSAVDMAKNNKYSFLSELDFAVFKSNKYKFQNEIIKSGKGRIEKKNKYFFHGHPNQIPLILFDLLHFEPSKIKVFYSNFFLSKKQYAKNYKKTLGRKYYARKYEKIWYKTWFRSFANHGYLSQLNFVKNLYKGGLIEVDKECKDVLELSSEEYIDKFLEIYG